MDRKRAGDTAWASPRNLTASYYGGPDVAEVTRAAFLRHIGENVIQQAALHPSVRTYERDVIDFSLSLFRAPEGATGTITTGGSESIALALKCARDRARDLKGITAPEIIVPKSGYAVLDKLSHVLVIKVIRMTGRPEARADVDGMAGAITPNMILLLASAPPTGARGAGYPRCACRQLWQGRAGGGEWRHGTWPCAVAPEAGQTDARGHRRRCGADPGDGQAVLCGCLARGAAGHKDDLWSFDHIDTVSLCIADAPRPDEIVMAVAFADGARINTWVPRF